MKKLIIINFFLLIIINIYSIDYTWTGAGDGVNWNNEANWDDGNGFTPGDGYPDDAFDTATIGGGNTVTLNENNLTIGNLTLDGTLNCGSNNFTIANMSGTGTFNSGSGTITINGDVTITNFNGDTSSTYITGNVNNTNFSASTNNTYIGGNFIVSTTFTHNNGTIVFNGATTPVDIMSATYYNITIDKTNATDIVRLSGLTNIVNNLTITQGILNLNGNNLDVNGSIDIQANGELRCASNEQINVANNWTNSGTFSRANSTVIFDTLPNSTISGNTIFNNFTCTTSGKTLIFQQGSTQTISGTGTLTITGTVGNLITLESSSSGNQWFINDLGIENISYVRVSDSSLTNSITAVTSKNNGNNSNWLFSSATLTWTGATNTNWNVDTNWDLGYVPNDTDNVIIADVANDPVLDINVIVNDLTINVNGILDTNGLNLTVNGTFSNNGRLRTNGTELLTLVMDTDSGEVEYKGGAGGSITFNTFNSLIINGAGSFTLLVATTINGNITILAGTLNGTGRIITVKGNWSRTGGSFTATNSTVIFDGTVNANVSAETFNNVEINKTGASVTATGIWNVGGNIDLVNGTFNPGTYTHNISGNWTETNITFTPTAGTINFITNSKNVSQKPGNNFFNFTVNTGAGKTVSLNSAILVNGALTITSGTLKTNGNTITVKGNFNNNAGAAGFTHDNGTVIFNSTTANQNFNSGGASFYNIEVNKTGRTLTLTNHLTQSAGGVLNLVAGTINLNTRTWNLGANFTQNAGTITVGTGHLNGGLGYNITQSTGTITQTTGTLTCNDFTKSGGTYSISGNGTININNNFSMTAGTVNITATPTFNITNNFSVTGGTFTANSSVLNIVNDFTLSGVYTYNANSCTVNVSGNISISGNTFNYGTSTFVMQGVAAKTISSNQNIYNLTINTTSTKSLASNITQAAGGVLTITNGTLDLAGFTLNLGANFSQNAGTLIIGNGTFNGGAGYNVSIDTGATVTQSTGTVNCNNFAVNGTAFYTITGVCSINVSGNTTILSANWNAGSSTINMSGATKTINASQALNNLNITGSVTIDTNNLNIDGSLTINNGSLNTGTQDIYIAGNFSITGTGTFTCNTRKVIFDGNGDQDFTPRISSFYDIEINKTGGTVNLLGSTLNIGRDFIITAGTFDTGTQNISITRDFLVNGGTFIPNNQTITFTGAVDSNFKPNNLVFWNLVINKNAANLRITQLDNLNSCNNFTITQGIYDINGNNWTVANTFSNDGVLELNGDETTISVTNDIDSGLVRYKGGGAGTLKVGNIYYNLEFNNGAGTWTLTNNLTVNNNINITAGTLEALSFQINFGGAWSDTGTFSSNADQVTRVFAYGTSTPQINLENNFKRVIIDASGKTITIAGNITCNYFALYKGTIAFSGTRTVTVNGDFLALGNNGYINDTLTLDEWAGPVRINDTGSPYGGTINLGATGSTLFITGDFYVNGCNLNATANWNLNIPDNDDNVKKARAYGTITVQSSQATHWVTATDGPPVDGGGNTNWDFGRPNVTISETRFDNVIYIQFNDLIENSNNEFNNAITTGWLRYNNDTDTFIGAFSDEACTTPLTNTDFNSCYLKISDVDKTWNTGATGVSAGVGTDSNGNVRNIIPNITIRTDYKIRDKAKNRILSLPFTYNGTIDRCKPVLISVDLDTETSAPNTFNIVKITFSEPMMAPGINTSYQNSDGTNNISVGGTGSGLTVAGNFAGFGNASNSGTIVTHANNMNTIKATDANKREFIIRLGGNVTDGGAIYSNSPPTYDQISGNFQPNANLRDANNNLIDASITRVINVVNNWELTPPTFSQIETNERNGQINGFIDNLVIAFDKSVQVYDNENNFGNSTVIWGPTTYTVANVNHSQNNIQNDFNLNLVENTTNTYGDTNSTPTITYLNDSNFKFIANVGRVEMESNHNIVAIDKCNPVITKVSFGIDDPSFSFKSAPYYNTITGAVEDPGSPPYNFNMHSTTGGTTLPPEQKTYHNYIMFKFSEPIANLNGVIVDSSSDGYSFDNSQRSTNAFGDFITAAGVVTVSGFGNFQGNITVESSSNFILFDDSQTVFIHVAGFYDTIANIFVGHITNSDAITVPNSFGTHYFTTINNANITDTVGLSLVKRDTGGANSDKILIDYEKDWDIIQPVFRYIPSTVSYKGDPVSNEIPPTTLENGAATGKPLLNRVEFVMSKAIRDLDNSTDMSGVFSFVFEKGSTTKPAINLKYNTTVNKLGDLINQYIGTTLIDSDINDQGFSITFDEETGMTDDARIKWTYQQVAGKMITDLRGLRLQPVSTERYTLENKAPYILETRAVVGSNKMYVEFNENVYHNPMGDLQLGDFTYTNVFSSGITITNLTQIDRRRYILTLSQRIYQDHISQDLIRANANMVQDSLNNVIDTDFDHPVSYIGINFFEQVSMEDFVHRGEGWTITKFDGTERITISNMKVIAKINVSKFSGFRPILYYDVIDGNASKFWYPSKNKDARMVLGVSKGNNIWEFNIPSNDEKLKTGKELSFVFKIGNLYCYRAPRDINDPKFSPYDAETYRIKIAELKEQNNSVSIYNNVINPNNNEETKLIYFIEKAGPVSIVVYDLSGNVVKVLVQKTEAAGKHIISWNGVNENGKIVARGVYFIRVRAPGIFNQIRKVLVVK